MDCRRRVKALQFLILMMISPMDYGGPTISPMQVVDMWGTAIARLLALSLYTWYWMKERSENVAIRY